MGNLWLLLFSQLRVFLLPILGDKAFTTLLLLFPHQAAASHHCCSPSWVVHPLGFRLHLQGSPLFCCCTNSGFVSLLTCILVQASFPLIIFFPPCFPPRAFIHAALLFKLGTTAPILWTKSVLSSFKSPHKTFFCHKAYPAQIPLLKYIPFLYNKNKSCFITKQKELSKRLTAQLIFASCFLPRATCLFLSHSLGLSSPCASCLSFCFVTGFQVLPEGS